MERMNDYKKEFDLACEKIVKLEEKNKKLSRNWEEEIEACMGWWKKANKLEEENKKLKEENENLKAIIEHYKKFEEGKEKLEGMLMEEAKPRITVTDEDNRIILERGEDGRRHSYGDGDVVLC